MIFITNVDDALKLNKNNKKSAHSHQINFFSVELTNDSYQN